MQFEHPSFPWLAERTILLAQTGSFAYGTNVEESDRDYKGVCIPPIDYYFGLYAFNEYNSSGGKNFRNTKNDVDVTIMHIVKFVKDAMKGVPNNIELLFIREKDYLKITEAGKMLVDARHLFLSKQIYKKCAGYARSQMEKMKKQSFHTDKVSMTEELEKSNSDDYTLDYQNERCYDTKLFMHTIRLLTSAIEILETGDYSTYRPNRQELLDCRNGKYSFSEALQLINMYDQQLKIAYEKSNLPLHPDQQLINQLLLNIHQSVFSTYT